MRKVISVLLVLVFLIIGAVLLGIGVTGVMGNGDALLSELKNLTDAAADQLNSSINDLLQITASGHLITDAQGNSLLGSGITGEGYEFDTAYYPYYSFLGDTERSVYRQGYANAAAFETTFLLTAKADTEQVERALDALLYDHPELFWLDTAYSYSYLSTGLCLQVTLQFNLPNEDLPQARSNFDAAAAQILSEAQNRSTVSEREKVVHDALILQTEYTEDAQLSQSAYSALVLRQSVCAGYARAFQYLMCRLGIPTYYCTGSSGGSHAWNIIQLDGRYFNVDLTWDDTNGISYTYYNKTDREMAQTHTRDEMSSRLPACG